MANSSSGTMSHASAIHHWEGASASTAPAPIQMSTVNPSAITPSTYHQKLTIWAGLAFQITLVSASEPAGRLGDSSVSSSSSSPRTVRAASLVIFGSRVA